MNALPVPAEKRPDGCPPGQGTIMPAHGGRIGNPPHVVTEESLAIVKRLATKVPVRLLAEIMGISVNCLYTHYRAELAQRKGEIAEEFGDLMLNKIRAGDNDLLKFYCVRMLGFDETKHHEHSGPGGGPIQHVDVAQLAAIFAGMSKDERAVADRVLSAIAAAGGAGESAGGGGSPEGTAGR